MLVGASGGKVGRDGDRFAASVRAMIEGSGLPLPGDTIAGKYVLECILGEGGMSVVYGATHRVTGKRFAIKWMLPDETPTSGDTARRFIREAQVAGLFQHPNVVEVYDVGQVAKSLYMVMEWLDGESLASRLEREGSITFENVCAYLIPCMYGVTEAHAAGIVHRDLKPANIFLCRAMHHMPERPKVLDFGIAKLSKQLFDVNSLVTKSGVLIGTPHYLSPEQLRSQPVDHRTDIYAFGVIMYQLLSGRLPFPADSFGQLVLQIATGTPDPLRDLVPGLAPGVPEVVAKAMAREPEERFRDLRALIATLEDVARGGVPLIAASAPHSAMTETLEQPREAPPTGLTYPTNGPPPLPSQRTPSGARPVAAGTQQLSGTERGVELSGSAPAAEPARRYWPYVAAAGVLIAACVVLAIVWRMQSPAAASATKPVAEAAPAHVSQPSAAETTASAATDQPVHTETAGAALIAPEAAEAPPSEPAQASSPTPEPRQAPAPVPNQPSRTKRAPRVPPAAPTVAAPAEPAPEPEVPAAIDRNPLHMKLQ